MHRNQVSPLACPRCKKEMRVVAVIDNIEVIRRILEHLGLWLANARPIPRAHSPPGLRPLPEDSYSQLPAAEEEDYAQLPPAHWGKQGSDQAKCLIQQINQAETGLVSGLRRAVSLPKVCL